MKVSRQDKKTIKRNSEDTSDEIQCVAAVDMWPDEELLVE